MNSKSATLPSRLVCFAHGKESGPWGTKITHLAKTAQRLGFEIISPDYSHTHDPRARVAQLLALTPKAECLVLVGSSMGGYVSAMASEALAPAALMLLAPAVYFPGFDEEPAGIPKVSCVVHGWHDDVVPVDRAIRFAKTHTSELHLLDSGHTLNDQLPTLSRILEALLARALEVSHVPDTSRRAALETAYSRARYTVQLPYGDLTLGVGQLNADSETRLREAGVSREWSIVTPYNPRNRAIDGTRNRADLERLRAELQRYGMQLLPTVSHDPLGHWPDEHGFLIIDPVEGLPERLGRQFDQHAILRGGPGRSPQLVWL